MYWCTTTNYTCIYICWAWAVKWNLDELLFPFQHMFSSKLLKRKAKGVIAIPKPWTQINLICIDLPFWTTFWSNQGNHPWMSRSSDATHQTIHLSKKGPVPPCQRRGRGFFDRTSRVCCLFSWTDIVIELILGNHYMASFFPSCSKFAVRTGWLYFEVVVITQHTFSWQFSHLPNFLLHICFLILQQNVYNTIRANTPNLWRGLCNGSSTVQQLFFSIKVNPETCGVWCLIGNCVVAT